MSYNFLVSTQIIRNYNPNDISMSQCTGKARLYTVPFNALKEFTDTFKQNTNSKYVQSQEKDGVVYTVYESATQCKFLMIVE